MKTNQCNVYSWHSKLNRIVVALSFIVVGLMFVGRNLGIVDQFWFNVIVSWQMLLVVVGVTNLIKGHFWGGIVTMGVGVFFLLPEFTYLEDGWMETYWPLIFVLVGLSLLFKHRTPCSFEWNKNGMSSKENYTSDNGFVASDNVFGSVQQIVLDPVFRGAQLKCTFGGTILDLRRTRLEAAQTFIDVECTFGGIEIFVPGDWNVQTHVQAVMGGSEDKRYNTTMAVDMEHTLIIRGKVTFGGLELKN